MAPSYPRLTSFLEEAGIDGYLVDADGSDSDQYYLSGLYAMGEFVTLYADGEVGLLALDFEYARARTDSDADRVHRFSEFDFGRKVVEHGTARAGPLATVAFLSAYGIDSVSVPVSLPNGTADVLRDPDPTIREYDVAREAYDAALETIRPGVTGEAVNDAVCDVFERGVRRFEPTRPPRAASRASPATASGSTSTNGPNSAGTVGSSSPVTSSRSNLVCTNREPAASSSRTRSW